MFIRIATAIIIIIGIGFSYLHLTRNDSITKPTYIKGQNLSNVIGKSPEIEIRKLTLDNIFTDDHSWVNTMPKERKRILIATGDVIPARVVNMQATKLGNFKWPYENAADFLRKSDLTFVNLETPLIKDCPLSSEGFKFCGSDKNVEGLIFAGVDVASLANNHSGNFGTDALQYTKKLLESKGVAVTGVEGPIYKEINGLKFAFLGFNDIGHKQRDIEWTDENNISQDIQEARHSSDVVVVSFHWGTEYKELPDQRQRDIGRFAIDAGADLVIGNHPHWIQPIEIYKDKLITYAHGNFIFDQEWSLRTKQGVVGKYIFLDNTLVDVEFIPIQIENFGQPYFLENKAKQEIIEQMLLNSQKIAGSDS